MAKEVWNYAFMVGPPTGYHSMIWRLSCDRYSNIFLCVRQTGCLLPFKTTFHPPNTKWLLGKRNEGLTTEFIRKKGIPAGFTSRHLREWGGDKILGPGCQVAYRLLYPSSQGTRFPIPSNPGRPVDYYDAPARGETYVFDLIFHDEHVQNHVHAWEGSRSGSVKSWSVPDGRTIYLVIHSVPNRLFKIDDPFIIASLKHLCAMWLNDPETFSMSRLALWMDIGGVPACADVAAEGLYRSRLYADAAGENELFAEAREITTIFTNRES